MAELSFLKSYIQGALAKGINEGTRATIEDLASGLSEENLSKFIEVLSGVLEKKKLAKTVVVKQVK